MVPVQPKQTLSMQTRDRIRLDADVYYPAEVGEFPVLLMRQPYGRAIASTVVYAHPTWYAAQGYIVVIQDVRGRGTSEGEFDLFAHEIEDGFDTVEWAAKLPGSTGQVGMYGFSYQGMTQLFAAAAKPPALKTVCPAMVGYDLYHDWAYEGDAFCYQLNLGWAIQLAAETARRAGDETAYLTLYAASRNPPMVDPAGARSALLRQLVPNSFYHDWLDRPADDGYWKRRSPCYHMEGVDLPMLHIGGWYDTHLRGTLRGYGDRVAHSTSPQQLLVGPWPHLPWGRRVGAVDFGEAAANPVDPLQIRWFDHFLKGKDTGLLQNAPVTLFEMGSNQWRSFDAFPSNQTVSYFLHTSGLAAMGTEHGTLTPQAPPDRTTDVWVHDPWRPVPAVGGHATFPAGCFDRASLDCRTDVVTYTTDPLTEDLHLAGECSVNLYCTADQPSFDLCAVLSEVKPNGSAFNITQGYRHVKDPSPVSITLQPTCACIPKGSALRLSLSAACFPAYAVNMGDGTASGHGQIMTAQVTTLTIHCGKDGDLASHVRLPVAPILSYLPSVTA